MGGEAGVRSKKGLPSCSRPLPLATHVRQGKGCTGCTGSPPCVQGEELQQAPRGLREGGASGSWGSQLDAAVDAGIVQGIRTPALPHEPNAEFCQGGRQEEVSASALRVGVFLCPKKCSVPSMLKAATQGWGMAARPLNSDQQGNRENRMPSLLICTSLTLL